jgi:hypothetical protein
VARADLISAALRHIRDAEHLLAPGPDQSVEQALHLAGFAPECARKGCIDDGVADKALGHGFAGGPDAVADFLLGVDPSAGRYAIDLHAGKLPERARHWTVECRYLATRAPAELAQPAGAVVREARAFVDACVLDLWSDGALPAGALTLPRR